MTRLTRTLALIVLFLSLFVSSAGGAWAQVSGQGINDPQQAVGLSGRAGVTRTSAQDNVAKTLKAVSDSVTEGTPSLNSLVDDTSISWQTSLFLTVAGAPQDDATLQSMTEEQKRIISQRYGRGVIGQISQGIVAMYTPPASAQTYLADALHSAHIIPQAQAQGLGFASLDPILKSWKVFRNVAYLFFVVIFLIIGFMIMFRQRIGGQTVVTAQQAIPGVIISLVFVTFSYAIAGFMIDLMYLLMYLLIGLFDAGGGTELLSKSIFGVGADLVKGINNNQGAFSSVNEAVQSLVEQINLLGLESIISWAAGITIALVISIAVLIGVFKLFFELLKTYVTIIISIVTAPLMLMIGALPGKNNFGTWIKTLAGNLLAFPVVLLALIFYNMFVGNTDLSTGGFLPPFMIGRGNSSVMMTLVGIGIILVIPELVKEVKKALGAEGGIFATLAGAAWNQAKEGAPLGLRIAGGVGGGGLMSTVGLAQGLYNARGEGRFIDKLPDIIRSVGYKGVEGLNQGVKLGSSGASAIGAKSPAALQSVEKAIDWGAKTWTEREILDRIANDKDIWGRDLYTGETRAARMKEAEDKRDARRAMAGFGKAPGADSDKDKH